MKCGVAVSPSVKCWIIAPPRTTCLLTTGAKHKSLTWSTLVSTGSIRHPVLPIRLDFNDIVRMRNNTYTEQRLSALTPEVIPVLGKRKKKKKDQRRTLNSGLTVVLEDL